MGKYRLSGCGYIFQRKPIAIDGGPRDQCFVEGTILDAIRSIYVFDKRFRFVVLDAI